MAKFLKPREDDDDNNVPTWQSDKPDVNTDNVTSFIFNSNVSLGLEQQKQRLPIFKNRNHILHLLESYQTLILVGETGSGKSTQVPQYLFEAGWCSGNRLIGITEPRRISVTSLATRVSDELRTQLGHIVGYTIRFDDCTTEDVTKIKYMTEGILMREMMTDPLLRKYAVIMLDEVHERTIFTDILMGLLKKILKKRSQLKLIISSATVDAEEICHFFNTSATNNATILSVKGQLYPVSINYAIDPIPNYVRGVVDTTIKLHEAMPVGDILAFVIGLEQIEHIVKLLKEYVNQRTDLKLLILPMHGSLPNNEQIKVFRPTPRGMRKIVIATNIAETSITIPGIVYVIDPGFVKAQWFNPNTLTNSLVVVPISKASAIQRAGRAGRVRSGYVYRLYTEDSFKQLNDSTPPEMQRTELSSAVLQLKALGIHNILRFAFPSPPPAQNLRVALELLFALGALDEEGNLTKPLGETMAELPLHPIHAKVLLGSGEFDCSEEIASILSLLQVQDIFIKPSSGALALKARVLKRNFEVEQGDLLTLLNIFSFYEKQDNKKEFCHKYFFNYKVLKRVTELKAQMISLLRKYNVPVVSSPRNTNAVLKCLASGFFSNAAYLHHSGSYHTVRGDEELHIHPSSVLYTLQQPQWVVFNEIVHTNRSYMKDLCVIDHNWLLELAPHYYQTVINYGGR
uniref:RNA helicase n=1 Tax=Cacopsylla melanoneura TaxID=428564 RepID=A0A8D8SM24_9HEMI